MKKILFIAGSLFISSLIVATFVLFLSANQIKLALDKQTHVKWDETNHELKVYISLLNHSKEDISFEASLHILKEDIVNITGHKLIKLEKDYMNRTSPFIISPYKDEVLEISFYTENQLNKEDLEDGFELIIETDNKSLTLPIKQIFIE